MAKSRAAWRAAGTEEANAGSRNRAMTEAGQPGRGTSLSGSWSSASASGLLCHLPRFGLALDHHEVGPVRFDDPIDTGDLVTRDDEEAVEIRSDRLVGRDREGDRCLAADVA